MKIRWLNPFLVFSILFALISIFYNSWSGSIVNSDDAIYSEIIKQILKRGEWINLYWQDYNYVFKPPLFFWIGAVSAKIFSFGEFALRFPSALFGFLTVLLVFIYARSLGDNLGAFIAAMVLLGFELFLNLSHRVMLDVTLSFFITLSIFTFWKTRQNNQYFYIAWFSCGLAFLVKGYAFFPSILVPLLYFILIREPKSLFKKESILGFFSMILLILPWQLYNYLLSGASFFDKFLKGQVIKHYSGEGFTYFKKPLLYYVKRFYELDLAILFLLLLAVSLVVIFRKRLGLDKFYLFFIWIAVYLGVYSFSSSKLDHYIIGMYPACALVIGVVFGNLALSRKRLINIVVAFVAFIIALSNFIPYVNKDGWLVDSSGEIKRLVLHYNEVCKARNILYLYKIYLPVPVFYCNTRVVALEPDMYRYNLFNSVDEFKSTGIVVDLSMKKFSSHFNSRSNVYCLIKRKDLNKLEVNLENLHIVKSLKNYLLVSNRPCKPVSLYMPLY